MREIFPLLFMIIMLFGCNEQNLIDSNDSHSPAVHDEKAVHGEEIILGNWRNRKDSNESYRVVFSKKEVIVITGNSQKPYIAGLYETSSKEENDITRGVLKISGEKKSSAVWIYSRNDLIVEFTEINGERKTEVFFLERDL